jgi:hypothetical protein
MKDSEDRAAFSVDKLREEETARYLERSAREKRILHELQAIKGLLWAIVFGIALAIWLHR